MIKRNDKYFQAQRSAQLPVQAKKVDADEDHILRLAEMSMHPRRVSALVNATAQAVRLRRLLLEAVRNLGEEKYDPLKDLGQFEAGEAL